ncbi:hypothetical protein EDD15DRAFT_2527846 [Pisolithus albus]|nr:hypothetical protein EDD15DRAFT_2527846 [Pisolithus albus]
MHHCLLIDEVLNNIFSWLGPGATLCNLARTCRAFYEPAAAIIWQKLEDFSPILRLLPEATRTAWAESRESESDCDEHEPGPPIVLTRPLTLEEWSMVKRLSQRVRDLRVFVTQRPHSYSITPGSLSFLLHPPGDESLESLFPNVQDLTFHCEGLPSLEAVCWQDNVLTLLRILIRPQLSWLALYPDGRLYALLNASGILASCPNLRVLQTSTATFETQEGARVTFAPTISSLQSLEMANIYNFSWDLLASLAQIKTLQRLFLETYHGLPDSPLPLTNEAFAGLCYLDTHITSWELVLSFYRWMPLGQLRGLAIKPADFARNDYSEDLEELLTLIPEHGIFLETIKVDCGFAFPRQPRHWRLTKSILTPYLSLRNLKVLDITLASPRYSPHLTDDDLIHMAQCWPLLKQLHLKIYASGWELPTGLSFRGIVALIQYCPDVEGFSLVFNAMEIPETVYRPDGNLIQNRRIRSLYVGNSPISSPEAVATFLRLLMPGLTTVSTYHAMDSTHKMHWTAVSASLRDLSARSAQP